jgi:hypothetical protein
MQGILLISSSSWTVIKNLAVLGYSPDKGRFYIKYQTHNNAYSDMALITFCASLVMGYPKVAKPKKGVTHDH